MPAKSKGARLWLRRARRDRKTGESHNAVWIIRDGKHTEGTGCRKDDREGAERALAEYLNRKHLAQASKGLRDPSQVPIADVLALYGRAKTGSQSRPKETAGRIERLLGFFGDKMLSYVTGETCRAYATRGQPTQQRAVNWRICALQSITIDVRVCATRWWRSYCPPSDRRVNGGSPGLKPHA